MEAIFDAGLRTLLGGGPQTIGLSTLKSRLPGVRRIAVLRANAIGDFVFALPALEALRAAYPGAEIVLLGRRWHEDFLRGRPGPVDRAIAVPHHAGVNDEPGEREDPAELEEFFSHMRQERFDLALQMHGGGRHSNSFLLRLGARFTAGLRTPDAPPLDRSAPYLPQQHEVLRYLEVASLVGAPPLCLEPHLEATEADLAAALLAAPELELGPVAVINPGAREVRRRWSPVRFAAVGDALARAGMQVVLSGSADELELCQTVASAMSAPARVLAGGLDLAGMVGLLARSRLVVSNDTGPLHVANALGVPTLGIFWWKNLFTSGPITASLHRIHVSYRIRCPECGRSLSGPACGHGASLVDDVGLEEVLASALDLFWSEAAPLEPEMQPAEAALDS